MARVFTWMVTGFNGEPYPGLCPDAPGPEAMKKIRQTHTLTPADEEAIKGHPNPCKVLALIYPYREKE